MLEYLKQTKYSIFFLLFLGYICSASFWIDNLLINWGLQACILIVLYGFSFELPFKKRSKRLFIVLLIVAFALKTLQLATHFEPISYVLNGLTFLIFVLLISHILKDIFEHKNDITFEMVMGAICVYALIGVIFGLLYGQLDSHMVNAFDFGNSDDMQHYERQFNLYYYSFTTLTTVGFGDIVPKSLPVKGVTIIEQMTGVLYLAVLVSKLVSSFRRRA